MKKIGLSAFLAEIDINIADDKPHTFSIEFVKAGKNQKAPERGKIKKIENAYKSYKPKTEQKQYAPNDNKKDFYRVKEKGILLLYDNDKKEHFSVIIDLITKYNEYVVIH